MTIWGDFLSASISTKVLVLIGVLYLVVCILLAAVPNAILSMFDWASTTGRYSSAILDLVFGIVFIWAAPSTRFPGGFNIIGVILLLGAAFYFLIPTQLWMNYFNWWTKDQLTLARILSVLFGLPFSAFVVFGAIPPSNETTRST